MSARSVISRIVQHEDLNFLLTNRVPRHLLTRFMGWFSQRRHPWVRDLSIGIWKLFADLDLSEARKQHFDSLHDCFTRQLREGARPIDRRADVLTSPCDGIVGACGEVQGVQVFQAKGFPYTLMDLFGDASLVERFRDGTYVTLRLTSSMYHRFHAPHDWRVEQVVSISGDTWNVNPIALQRIEKLFCKNERAVLTGRLEASGHRVALVPVAAILVASIRLHFLDLLLHCGHRGPKSIDCDARFLKGQEMGWFQHGSTILVFASRGFALCEGLRTGQTVRMGQPLLHLPRASSHSDDPGAG